MLVDIKYNFTYITWQALSLPNPRNYLAVTVREREMYKNKEGKMGNGKAYLVYEREVCLNHQVQQSNLFYE